MLGVGRIKKQMQSKNISHNCRDSALVTNGTIFLNNIKLFSSENYPIFLCLVTTLKIETFS